MPMNKIEKLIKELCPNGVEWKKLIDVANVLYGFPCDSNMFTEDSQYIPLIRIRDVLSGTASSYTTEYISDEYIIKKGDILVGMDGNFNLAKWNDRDGYLNQRVCKIETKDSEITQNNYLFHYLKPLFKQIELETAGGSVIHLSAKKINSIHIPLPPLPIQTEIVRILDKFVEQQEQLERLIELRKKQYEYYREEMLKPKEGEVWERKTLGEIGTFVRGNGLQKTDFREEGFPCIHYGQVHTYYGFSAKETKSFCNEDLYIKLKKASYGDLIIATTSEDVEACCKATIWLGEGEVGISGDSYLYSHSQNPEFIGHLFKTKHFAEQKRIVATGAKVVRVSGDSMAKFEFQIPSLDKQKYIAESLNNFESSISSLKSALELSKKRYEYYRDKMLRF